MKPMTIAGIVLLVAAVVCLFIAFERYQANASAVKAMNQMGGGVFQTMTGGKELTPSTPAATKYALLGALIFGVGGGYCLLKPNHDSGT
jgi:hypothetical protein